MRLQNGLFVVVALCRGGCRFFAVCFKLHFSTFTMKTNEKPAENNTLGSLWWSGSSFCPRLAVRIGFSCLIRLCRHRFVFDSRSHGRDGAGMMSFGFFGGLEVLPALAVPCGLASAASFVC